MDDLSQVVSNSSNEHIAGNVEFSSIIAVAVHDMKNSLSLLLQSIEQLSQSVPQDKVGIQEELNSVQYQANRMNTTLVQILSLYRANINALPLNVDECFIDDLFAEIVDSNKMYIKQKKLNVTINVDDNLSWFLDRDLIYLMLSDVLINAIRYGGRNIEMTAKETQRGLHVSISDDGSGYPQSMLDMATIELDDFCIVEGRTGLGLFFARLIAQTHQNGNNNGKIMLSNNKLTGGSVFEVILP